MTLRLIRFSCAILLCHCLGCANTEQDSAHQFKVHLIDGVKTAENSGGPLYSPELFTYIPLHELEQDLNGESLLISPTSIRMDERGLVYVCDVGDSRIKIFDSEGNYLRACGREGAGPGEFLRAFLITEIRDGMITVYEKSQRRITRFQADGTLSDVIPVPGVSLFENEIYQLGDDLFLGLGLEQGNPSTMPGTLRSFALFHSAIGDTISHTSGEWVQVTKKVTGTDVWFRSPLGPNPTWSCRSDWGWVLTTGIEPELAIYQMSGELRLRIETGIKPVAITSADYGKHRAYMDQEMDVLPVFAEERGLSDRQIQSSIDRIRAYRSADLGDRRAYWKSIEIDDNHFLWLEVPQHYFDLNNSEKGKLYRVFNADGEYLGDSKRPLGLSGSRIEQGHFLAIEFDDEVGIWGVTIYQVHPIFSELSYP